MPMVPTRAVMLTGAAAASAVVAATCSDNGWRKPKLRKFVFSAHAVEVVMASAVLTVDDLLSAIFASFDAWDGAAACVCRAWRQVWADTDDGRRGLRQVTLDPRMLTLDPVSMCSPPSGAWHGVQQRDGVVIVDASMQVRHRLVMQNIVGRVARTHS